MECRKVLAIPLFKCTEFKSLDYPFDNEIPLENIKVHNKPRAFGPLMDDTEFVYIKRRLPWPKIHSSQYPTYALARRPRINAKSTVFFCFLSVFTWLKKCLLTKSPFYFFIVISIINNIKIIISSISIIATFVRKLKGSGNPMKIHRSSNCLYGG